MIITRKYISDYKTKLYILIAFISFLSIIPCLAYNPKTNSEIIESSIKKNIQKISNALLNQALLNQNIKSITLKIAPHPSNTIFEKSLIEELTSKNISVFTSNSDTSKIGNNLKISTDEFRISYELHPSNDDSLIRKSLFSYSVVLEKSDGRLHSITGIKEESCDTINFEDVKATSSFGYDFCTSPIPQQRKSFFKEVTEPVLIISTAIITAILLFTIRSG